MTMWDIVNSSVLAIMGFLMKGKINELDRLSLLVVKTREEVARDHVTRVEVNMIVDKLGERFDRSFERLEGKLDDITARK